MTDAALPSIRIDVVSDAVCPWCYIGLRRLDAARALAPDVELDINWRPYQLDPTIPAGGLDRKAYMEAKFGSGDRLKQAHARVSESGRDAGIDFAFDRIRVSPNTLDAHRVIRWAANAGPGIQDAVVRALFRAYFEQGRDIGDHAELAAIAAEAGMDPAIVQSLLPTEADSDAVRAEIETASRMGITGVPCFLFENRYAVVGAQDAATLADAITRIAEAKARGELETAAG